jgi:tetratricopeptide (TPR) repeat protein
MRSRPRNCWLRFFFTAGQYQAAEQLYFELSRRPDQAGLSGKEGLAAVYAARGEYERALELTDQITKLAKKRAAALVLARGYRSSARRGLGGAKKYNNVLKKEDISVETKAYVANRLGRILMVSGKDKKAVDAFKAALAIAPLYATARYNLGIQYQLRGEWASALVIFERLRVLEPESAYGAALTVNASEVLALREDSEARGKMARDVGALAKRLVDGPWTWSAP